MKTEGNLAVNLQSAQKHILFHHDPRTTDGWITLARKDPHTRGFKQYHYKPEELADCLSEWTGEDVYFSQNSFFKPQRRIDNIRQLRSLYVDLDVYNVGITPEFALGKLELEFFRQSIPEPNAVIFSGRGLVLIWNIEPIPYMVMPLWRAVETYFLDVLKELGADSKASDPARIFRLPGTTNSKSKTIVTAQYRHEYRYDIHDIQYDYLPELTPSPATKTKKTGKRKGIARLFNTYTMNLVRARDITRLVELREGEVNSYRELICFLYRYFTCCCSNDPQRALEETLSLNDEFSDPLPVKEVKAATKSAEKAWAASTDTKANEIAKSLGYPGAGYRLTNKKIIEWLDISPEEQVQMDILIGPKEKRRRNTLAKMETRRAQGVKSRKEYLSEAELKRTTVQNYIAENPNDSVRAISEATGIAKSTVQRIKSSL